MKAIITKYLGPTNTKGSRIKATDGDNSVTVSLHSDLNCDDNHARAAEALCRGGLSGRGGVMAGMVWVDVNTREGFEVRKD